MNVKSMLAGVLIGLVAGPSGTAFAEPYPFRTRPREVPKAEWLSVDFEQELPAGTELGSQAEIKEGLGRGGSRALVSSSKGSMATFPISQSRVGQSRFDLMLEYGGEGFARFRAKINAYDRDDKLVKSTVFRTTWAYSRGIRPWELQTVNVEVENIHRVELELEQLSESGTVWVDNIVLRRHDAMVITGRGARSDLTIALRQEGLKVDDLIDVWVGTAPDRQSFFDFKDIEENKRYVRSDWQERLHIGTTYKTTRGQLPTFMLGVSARQEALKDAAGRQNKTLVQMYEFFLDDIAAHGFNCVWVDFTEDLEKFDQLASARGISVILRDPEWSGLEKWIANRDGAMPSEFRTAAAENAARYAKLRSLLGYHVSRPLSSRHQPMLAEAREYLNSVAPRLQLVDQQSDVNAAEELMEPYPNIGIQHVGFHHYLGRPWASPSHMYHPNYWPRALIEGHYRRVLNGFRVRTTPTLIAIPTGRQYGKKSIDMQQDRVIPETNGWVYDAEAKRWSGWYRYQYPPNLLRSIVWTALQGGAAGVLFEEWGPAAIGGNVTGSELLNGEEYADGSYQPDLLRLADMSESDGWKELGQVARELAPYRALLAVSTLHGQNNVRTNQGDVRVNTLTGRDDPFRVLVVANTRVGDYDDAELKYDRETGALEGYGPAEINTFKLMVEKDYGLIDMRTGRQLEPVSTADRTGTYELQLGPGEGRFFFRGKLPIWQRFAQKYNISTDGARARAE